MRRVVVTGMGVVTPLGSSVDVLWDNIIRGNSGIIRFTEDDYFKSQVGGVINISNEDSTHINTFNPEKAISKKDQRKCADFIIFAIEAARQAIIDSGIDQLDDETKENIGTIISSGIGGLDVISDGGVSVNNKKKLSPFFIPSSLINLAPGWVSMQHGFGGANFSIVSACATGAHSIGEAFANIKAGRSDIIVCGGAEKGVLDISVTGFCSMRALSTNFNNQPEKASRPWDKDRDGFVISDGGAILVLEEYEHAKKRGAKIYGEIAGYGLTGDAYHISSPQPEGKATIRAMKNAIKEANINSEDIGYVNAHGTSTPMGDDIELKSIKNVFNNSLSNIMVSSTKSALGHSLGATGSVEAILSLKAMESGIIPPTLNLENPSDEAKGLDLVPLVAKEKKLQYVMSNSFGFGGTNSCLVFKKI